MLVQQAEDKHADLHESSVSFIAVAKLTAHSRNLLLRSLVEMLMLSRKAQACSA